MVRAALVATAVPALVPVSVPAGGGGPGEDRGGHGDEQCGQEDRSPADAKASFHAHSCGGLRGADQDAMTLSDGM
ncbi:hypothetical protein SBD_6067 [Streptomyces bottropensis ATCC 25435]|uniref:Uncharacterized protein n=1 Tax=Streptomyces bottropensis ATCC 25435 TaxID=1054862 RepID=M3E9Z1_9ACTN|nr:hypothetical protein SBD_6067 [Streptomyces bottropensis ATCC 25435]